VTDNVDAVVAAAYRTEWGKLVAYLIRHTGDWTLAEECAADAFATALERWPDTGVPANPGAWLTTTARNRAFDRLRRASNETVKLRQAALMRHDTTGLERGDDSTISDDRLRLIFTCCHPALALEARVALTLRTLAGLTTVEIAHAFAIPEATMAKRLVRAKAKIGNAAIPYRVPPDSQLPERLHGVLGVIYLLFNEGYDATAGPELIRVDVCDEAIRLARLLSALMTDEPEVDGLLALMLFHHARRHARVDAKGDLVTLDAQDRARWDHTGISEAVAVLQRARRRDNSGAYQLQAEIASCHATAPTPADTDWNRIAQLYTHLYELTPTAFVGLNWAVAVAMVDGPDAGLELIDRLDLDDRLAGYHLLAATRADLHRRAGRTSEAIDAYRQARDLTTNDRERAFLDRRIAELTGPSSRP
jgi:RNA polymerase sigma-70 factor, ECF subfamily